MCVCEKEKERVVIKKNSKKTVKSTQKEFTCASTTAQRPSTKLLWNKHNNTHTHIKKRKYAKSM